MKIGIINDIVEEIELLKNILRNYSDFEVLWTALNGDEAISLYKNNRPDMLLMNLNMPIKDGVITTKAIMEISPVAILLITSAPTENQAKVFEAMGYGALDVVRTPFRNELGEITGGQELIKKIDIFSKLINYHKTVNPITQKYSSAHKSRTKLVAIGSSTGGPKALSIILRNIPPNTECAFVIIQHVDSQFANGLADWLKNYSNLPLHLAESGNLPQNGNVYIANTNGAFEYTPQPVDNHFRPSVDVFFNSLVKNWAYKDMAVLLTGMGYDGGSGLLNLKNIGWQTIAQDEATSVVYGMPKVAKELGAAIEILPIGKISDSILKFINKG
jgi:two-component system response regulator WspF